MLRPVVQRSRIKICSIGPYDCVYLWIDADLFEQTMVPQRTEDLPCEYRLDVDPLPSPIIEADTERIAFQHLHGNDSDYGVFHLTHL